jgi:hypothetical protein
MIGGFNSLPDWLAYIPKSELSEGGRVRHLANPNGETIVERLEKFDNAARSCSYSILRTPFPKDNPMKAARLQEYGKPLVLEDIAVPDIQSDEILANVKACGMCRSDVPTSRLLGIFIEQA